MIPIPWTTATHKTRSEAANASRLINLFVEALPQDSQSDVVLYGTPGTVPFCELPTFGVEFLHEMRGTLYAGTSEALYVIDQWGDWTHINNVTLNGRVSVADNGRTMVFVDGHRGYAYSPEDGFWELGGSGWYPADTVTYQDGYFIFNRAGTGQFFISLLFSTDFNALDFATAMGAPDDTVAVQSSHRELWVFGTKTIEVWYNSGNPDFPFERMQGTFATKGLGAKHSVALMDNSILWLGDDGIVYRANGYVPQRISTFSVEWAIAHGRRDDAFAYVYGESGHTFYVLTFPEQGQTWVYDAATRLWHERSHYEWGRHHSNCHATCYGKELVGDFQNGMIYQMDNYAYKDWTDPIRRVAISPPITNRRKRAFMRAMEIHMEAGANIGENPQARLQWSNDGGQTWSEGHWSPLGKLGQYLARVRWNRLGSFRERCFKLVITEPIPIAIIKAFAEIQDARH